MKIQTVANLPFSFHVSFFLFPFPSFFLSFLFGFPYPESGSQRDGRAENAVSLNNASSHDVADVASGASSSGAVSRRAPNAPTA